MSFRSEYFIHRFVLPLVGGGTLHVGRPLDSEDIEQLVTDAADLTRSCREIERVRRRVALRMWRGPVDVGLGEESLRLAAGVHNLLFYSHPAYESLQTTRALERFHAVTRRHLCLPQAASETELLARHTLLFRLPALRRTDVDLRFWVGRRSFVGQPIPPRLLRWRRLRRVRIEQRAVNWLGAVRDSRQRALVRMLFEGSPVTELVGLPRAFPAVRWERVVRYLRWPRVARAVCHEYLRLGVDVVGPSLALSFWGLVQRLQRESWPSGGPTRAEGRRALRLVVGLVEYLYACLAVGGQPPAAETNEWRQSLHSVLVAGRRNAVGQLGTPLEGGERAAASHDRLTRHVAKIVAAVVEGAEQRMGERAEVLAEELNQALRAPASR
jgi:hypothetical protein